MSSTFKVMNDGLCLSKGHPNWRAAFDSIKDCERDANVEIRHLVDKLAELRAWAQNLRDATIEKEDTHVC